MVLGSLTYILDRNVQIIMWLTCCYSLKKHFLWKLLKHINRSTFKHSLLLLHRWRNLRQYGTKLGHMNTCAYILFFAKTLCRRFCNLCDVGNCFALHSCYFDTKMYVSPLADTLLDEHYQLVSLNVTFLFIHCYVMSLH